MTLTGVLPAKKTTKNCACNIFLTIDLESVNSMIQKPYLVILEDDLNIVVLHSVIIQFLKNGVKTFGPFNPSIT